MARFFQRLECYFALLRRLVVPFAATDDSEDVLFAKKSELVEKLVDVPLVSQHFETFLSHYALLFTVSLARVAWMLFSRQAVFLPFFFMSALKYKVEP